MCIRDRLQQLAESIKAVDSGSFYTKEQADAKFGTPYSLPPATADQLGGVKGGDVQLLAHLLCNAQQAAGLDLSGVGVGQTGRVAQLQACLLYTSRWRSRWAARACRRR